MRALTIGGLARETRVKIETIRYYERIKLLLPPPRTCGGRRSYGDADIRRVAFIRRARELGFSIESIRMLLVLAEPANTSCADVRQIAGGHLESVRAKLADLAELERLLSETVARCSDEPGLGCPVIDVLSTANAGSVGD